MGKVHYANSDTRQTPIRQHSYFIESFNAQQERTVVIGKLTSSKMAWWRDNPSSLIERAMAKTTQQIEDLIG